MTFIRGQRAFTSPTDGSTSEVRRYANGGPPRMDRQRKGLAASAALVTASGLLAACSAGASTRDTLTWYINPDDGATLEQNVKEVLKLEPALIAKLKEILK